MGNSYCLRIEGDVHTGEKELDTELAEEFTGLLSKRLQDLTGSIILKNGSQFKIVYDMVLVETNNPRKPDTEE